MIEVADDGAGLDLERLRARGVVMGLVAAETPLSDPTVRDLVFAAGLRRVLPYRGHARPVFEKPNYGSESLERRETD